MNGAFSVTAVVAVATILIAVSACGEKDDSIDPDETAAIAAAKTAHQQAVAAGTDLATAGPCISEALPGVEGWVADAVHDPRTAVDDDPANQCQNYLNGTADHFVELTPEGVVIRAE